MEKVQLFRDYQEQQAADHNDLQAYARQSLDHIVYDAVTRSPKYAGFQTVKSSLVEIVVQPGRFYKPDGGVYNRATSLVQNLTSRLAAASKRIIVLAVSGQENLTNEQERDVLIDAETGETEPDTVSMTASRDAILTFWDGAESPEPQVPPIPAGHAAIAHILVDTLQVVSVTMLPGYEVESTESLDQRAGVLEADMAVVKPKTSALDAQLAALSKRIDELGDGSDTIQLMQDVGILKEVVGIPDDAANYGAEHFLTPDGSDVDNDLELGFDARIFEGLRFPYANQDISELAVFSANDPNAAITNGLLLPAYSSDVRLSIGPYHSDLSIGQFGYQTVDIVKRTMTRQRTRYGAPFKVSTSDRWWNTGVYDAEAGVFQKWGETFEVKNEKTNRKGEVFVRLREISKDKVKTAYWDRVVTEHEAVGAFVSQTFPVATDFWLTRIGFWLQTKAANEAVTVIVSEADRGTPDMSRAILVQTIPHGDLVAGGWNRVTVTPSFLEAGKRYAVSLIANANHKIGMALGQKFVDGTFFTSTDGVFHQGDITKDMLLEVWGAKFDSPQVAIELDALNLDGGIRAIDILAEAIEPDSTQIIWEIQPGATGTWRQLTPEDTAALSAAPPLCRFRVRLIGTRDLMPGVKLTGSQVWLSRPKTAMKWVSAPITLEDASEDIYARVLLEEFDDTPHDFTLTLRHGASFATEVTASLVTEKVLPNLPQIEGRVQRIYKFEPASPITQFVFEANATTNSAASVPHGAEVVYWAV